MSKVQLQGNVSGTGVFTIASPNSNIDRTLTLPDNSGTILTQNSQPSFASTIGVGGATPSTSGAGITFPATASPSSNANTLDDYEEGTWTPTSAVSLGISSATYQKIGNTVLINTFFDVGTNSNNNPLLISGLPFGLLTGSCSVGCFNNANTDLYAYFDGSGIFIRTSGNNSRTYASLSGSFLAFQLSYTAA